MRRDLALVLMCSFALATAPASSMDLRPEAPVPYNFLCNGRDWPLAILDAMSHRYMRSTADANSVSGIVTTTYAVEVWRQSESSEVQICRADTSIELSCSKRYWEFARVGESWKLIRHGVDVSGPPYCTIEIGELEELAVTS
jgi:hypothetical protein